MDDEWKNASVKFETLPILYATSFWFLITMVYVRRTHSKAPQCKHKARSINFAGTVQLSAPVQMYGTRTRNSC
jgi:hypothetical protein